MRAVVSVLPGIVPAWVGGFPLPWLILQLVDHGVEVFRDHLRLLEGLTPLAVEQSQLGGLSHVFHRHLGAALVGGDGAGSLVHHYVAAHAVNFELGTNIGDQRQDVIAGRTPVATTGGFAATASAPALLPFANGP